MIKLIRTSSENVDYIKLVKHLDVDLAIRDGELAPFYAQYNSSSTIKHILVAYQNNSAVGCGALKEFAPGLIEVKRMFTLPEKRGIGIATRILTELEKWAAEMSYSKCILETGIGQPEAIALYTKCGYARISNYGQYAGVEHSVCFEKNLKMF